MVRPRAFAVFRLITSSILVACWTGRSVGLGTFEDGATIEGCWPQWMGRGRPIQKRAARRDILPTLKHGGQPSLLRKRCNHSAMLNDRRVRHHNDPLDTLGAQTCECALELLGQAGVDGMRLQAQHADGILYLPQRESHGWVAGITHDANTPYLRNHLDQQLRLFATQIGPHVPKASTLPAWPRKTADEAHAHRGSDSHHDDRNSGGRRFGGKGGRCGPSHDDVDIAANELGSDVGNLLGRSLRPMIGDGEILPLDVTVLAQGITECPQHCGCRNRGSKKTNPDLFVPLALLRARRERPHRRAAEQRDERASLHSITSSAPTNIDAGIVTPIALAV